MIKRNTLIFKIKILIGIFFIFNCQSFALVFDVPHLKIKLSSNKFTYPFSIKFKNNNSYPVKIKNIKTTCGCLFIAYEDKVYLPNSSGELNGKITLSEHTESEVRKIKIITDDIKQEVVNLKMYIEVIGPVKIKPKLLIWRKNSPIVSKFIYLEINDEEYKFISAKTSSPLIQLEVYKEEKNLVILKITPKETSFSLKEILNISFQGKNSTQEYINYILIK